MKHPARPTLTWIGRGALFLAAALLLGSCTSHRPMMPTPDVYALGIKEPYAASLPAELRTVDVNVMYLTDRLPEHREDGRLDYGMGRDHAMALGEAVVNIGGDIGWEELAADARTGVRSKTVDLAITSVTEKARGPKGMLMYYQADGSRGGL